MKFEKPYKPYGNILFFVGQPFCFQLMFLTDPVGRASGVMFNTNKCLVIHLGVYISGHMV